MTAEQHQDSERLCPSARCEEGAILLGVVGEDGVVGYVRPLITIDKDFVRQAHKGRTPEKRFRFSQPCIEHGCRQWTGSRCGVIDRALQAKEEADIPDAWEDGLPKCTIRPRCRWFAQVGRKACAVCPLVITESEGEITESE